MKSRIVSITISLGLILLGNTSIGAQNRERTPLTAQLNGKFSVSFKTQTDPPNAFKLPSSIVRTGANVIHRIWIDKAEGIYFGYDLEIEPLNDHKQFKVSVKPLGKEVTSEIEEEGILKPLTGRSSARLALSNMPRLPQPQTVDDGDSLALDVLVNQQTGVKLVDLITVSSPTALAEGQPSHSDPARDFSLSDVELVMAGFQLFINGELVAGGKDYLGSCSGEFIYFYLRGRGRFVFSIKPHEGIAFQKLGLIQNKKISFSVGADNYEWVSNTPVVGTGGNWNLWVLHEPDYVPGFVDKNSTFIYGAMDGVRALRHED